MQSQSQAPHEIASRLELFRTETLAAFEPAETKKEPGLSDMNSYMDNILGLERFQVPEIPVVNSRAGLYIYLDAAVSCVSEVLVGAIVKLTFMDIIACWETSD